MPTQSFSLPTDQARALQALVRLGIFGNQSEAVRAGIKQILETLEDTRRLAVAVEIYRHEDITISKAADLAGVPFARMRDVLVDEGAARFGRTRRRRRPEADDIDTSPAAKKATRHLLDDRFPDD